MESIGFIVLALWAVLGGLGLVGYEVFQLVSGDAFDVFFLFGGIVLAGLGGAAVVYLVGRNPMDVR